MREKGSNGTSSEIPMKVKAFINLDGTNCELRELVLQAGPKHPWLMSVSRK